VKNKHLLVSAALLLTLGALDACGRPRGGSGSPSGTNSPPSSSPAAGQAGGGQSK